MPPGNQFEASVCEPPGPELGGGLEAVARVQVWSQRTRNRNVFKTNFLEENCNIGQYFLVQYISIFIRFCGRWFLFHYVFFELLRSILFVLCSFGQKDMNRQTFVSFEVGLCASMRERVDEIANVVGGVFMWYFLQTIKAEKYIYERAQKTYYKIPDL